MPPHPLTRAPAGRAPSTAALRSTVAGLVAVLALGLLAGCSDDGSAPASSDPSGTASGEAAPAPLATTVRAGRVVGRLPERARRAAVREVGRSVDGWVDAAYVGGSWPRQDFDRAFPGFTRGARADARADLRLLSNAAIGGRVEEVRATRRRLVVDLLADGGRARAATARLDLAFRTSGQVARRVRVTGRLFLTPSREGWQVFGYDLAKGDR